VTAVDAATGWGGMAGLAAWMTCVQDGREHAVLESDFAAGVADGLYRSVCGHLAMPRALASPCGARCPVCVATLGRYLATGPGPQPARHRGRGAVWWRAGGPRRVLGWVRGVCGGD